MIKLELEFDIEFEHEVSLSTVKNKVLGRLTIRKKKAEQLGLKGGEYVRVALIKDGKVSVFERRVSKVTSNTGSYVRLNVPNETLKYLGLLDSEDKTVKAFVKVLES